jgi:hypothetical protein
MTRTCREIAIDVSKAAGVGLAGAAMVVASFLLVLVLPVIGSLLAFVSILIADVVSGYGVMRVALSIVIASLASWLFQLSFGSLLLAWIVATIIGALWAASLAVLPLVLRLFYIE